MTERKTAQTNNKQVIAKLDELNSKFDTLQNAIVGDTKEVGLLERVRNLEQWVANEKRLIYLIVGIIIADIVTRLWSLLVK